MKLTLSTSALNDVTPLNHFVKTNFNLVVKVLSALTFDYSFPSQPLTKSQFLKTPTSELPAKGHGFTIMSLPPFFLPLFLKAME